MRSLPWRRLDLIKRIRRDLWRYLTPAADIEEELLEASALLRMPPTELQTLGALQFLVSRELGSMLDELPRLLRRLATTTTHEEEISAERVRGAIQWGRTLGLRYSSGAEHVYVTAPSRRAFQTPENEVLVFLLDETFRLGKMTGWGRSSSEYVGRLVRDRVAYAERWRQSRMLLQVERRPIAPRSLARIRSGRHRRRYEAVVDAYERYRRLVGTLDRDAIRHAVEGYGLVSRDDATLFELYCTFEILGHLRAFGWRLGRLGLFGGSLRLVGTRNGEQLEVTYQATPPALSRDSVYRETQKRHALSPGALRPDLVIRRSRAGADRWLLVEVKGGERSVSESARAATYDLLAYRSAFAPVLESSARPYGLGIAWGAGLAPSIDGDVALSTVDHLRGALQRMAGP